MADIEQPDYISLTVQLLSAYVANNIVASEDLAGLIQSTRAALIAETVPAPDETVEHVPAVSVRKSIASRDHILSLIDGRPYKTLKRHLATHGLTPAEYRQRYGLPESYPIVAQAYSEQRRAVAQKLGLGQRGTQARAAAAAGAAPSVEQSPTQANAAKPKAGRRKTAAPASVADSKAKTSDETVATSGPAAKRGRKAKVAADMSAAEPAKAKSPAKSPRRKLGIKASKADTEA
ncbi:MucR family transcriptional regulator [Sphingobium sp. HWE2-09]|uniref:MucR family transcriptional regulator n=1 Tax=Sphingobium sp. HWE2-09 TaxID=3108390 RepID=UPI002DD2702D|nr:MucR family transcriptional regulator [Sphingobium sp. HWE2-09]